MRLLFCGDIVGRAGREAIIEHIPILRKQLKLDVVVVNGENSAGGFGISSSICSSLYECGVDIITTGNHVWKQKEIIPYIDGDQRLLRPINYSNKSLPGKGVAIYTLPNGKKFVVIHVIAQLFMPPDPTDSPFYAVDEVLKQFVLGSPSLAGIMVDFHGEASSEKYALGHYLDGRVSFVVGTHTHVPTADAMILSRGTAFQSDAGMTGDFNSVIGMQKDIPLNRFLGKLSNDRLAPAEGEATLCGTYVEIDELTGLAKYISPIRVGGVLQSQMPQYEMS